MLKRVLTVAVGLPIVVLFVTLGGLPLVGLCTAIALFGLKELYHALSDGHKEIHLLGYGFTFVYFAVIHLMGFGQEALFVLTFFIVFAQGAMVLFFKKLQLVDVVKVTYGFLYIPFLTGFIVLLRGEHLGHLYVWLIFTAAFGCDTFAYLTGTAIGKHKLTGTPSPSKTVEGLAGGVFGAALVGSLYGLFVVFTTDQSHAFIFHYPLEKWSGSTNTAKN